LIRSLRFHAARHKVYLPQDLLGAVGLMPDQIMAGRFDEKVRAAIAQTILKADEHFRAAGLLRAPRASLPAFLPAALVPLYLRRAKRRSFDPLKHSGDVAQHRKQLALLRAALRRRL
jgi:phytoene synthase